MHFPVLDGLVYLFSLSKIYAMEGRILSYSYLTFCMSTTLAHTEHLVSIT